MVRDRAYRRHQAERYLKVARRQVKTRDWEGCVNRLGWDKARKMIEDLTRRLKKNRRACSCALCSKERRRSLVGLESPEQIYLESQ